MARPARGGRRGTAAATTRPGRGERRDRRWPSTRSAGSRIRIARSTGCRPSRRSSCSPIGANGREVPGRRQGRPGRRLRRHPGRPAGRRARPPSWPTRRPAQRVLARAVMNGETTRRRIGWRRCSRACSARVRPATPATRPGPRTILAASLAVADRGEQVRSQVRGAIVEELTAVPAGAPGRRGRGPPRAPHPVRRRPGRDPPLRRDRRARRRRRGVRLQVGRAGHQRRRAAPARRRAQRTPPTRTSGSTVALVVFDAGRSCDGPARRARRRRTRRPRS